VRRIYPLSQTQSFADLAEALADTELDLARVVSCTFPGRPEPKSAEWRLPVGTPVIAYEYEPYFELRYLHVLSPDFSLFADGGPQGNTFRLFFVTQLGEDPFVDWESFRADLHSGDHAPARRAARVFANALRAADDTVDAELELMTAVTEASGRGPEAAAEQLADVATKRFFDDLERLSKESPRMEVRMYLKKARDRLF
jgi:hypothetical protein